MTPGKRHEKAPESPVRTEASNRSQSILSLAGARPSTPSGGTSEDETGLTDVQRARRLSDVPPKCRQLYRRAYAGKSRKAAIRAMCMECVQWSADEVRLCTDPACPLYEFRLKG